MKNGSTEHQWFRFVGNHWHGQLFYGASSKKKGKINGNALQLRRCDCDCSVFVILQDTKQFFAIKCVAKSSLSQSATDNLLREIKLLKTLKHKYIVEMTDFRWDEKWVWTEWLNSHVDSEYPLTQHWSAFQEHLHCDGAVQCWQLINVHSKAQNIARRHMQIFHEPIGRSPQVYAFAQRQSFRFEAAEFAVNQIAYVEVESGRFWVSVAYVCKCRMLIDCNYNLNHLTWSFAQILSPSEKNTVIKGSPLYMAPEILLKHCYNPSADLWSIGVILYECLFGSAPYSSKNMDELLHKIKIQQKIEIAKTMRISLECRDLLARLLVHDAVNRITFDDFFNHSFLVVKQAQPNDKVL